MGCLGDEYTGCGLVCLVAGVGYGDGIVIWTAETGG